MSLIEDWETKKKTKSPSITKKMSDYVVHKEDK